MSTHPTQPNRGLWISVVALGCFAVCLLVVFVGGSIWVIRSSEVANDVSFATAAPSVPPGMGVPPPLGDEGVVCLAEQGDWLFASASRGSHATPQTKYFASSDGGLTWSETSESNWPALACCTHHSQSWRLWSTDDGQVQYRFNPGASIEASNDRGKTWQREVDLTKENWAPKYAAGTPTPYAQPPRPGPADAIVHRPTGNVVVAAGNLGVLVRTTGGLWRWVNVGNYDRGDQSPGSATPAAPQQAVALPSPAPEELPIAPDLSIRADADSTYAFAVAFSPDSQTIASTGRDGFIRLWRVSDGALIRAIEHKDWEYGAVFSPDGAILATSGTNRDPTVRLWRVADGSPIRVLSDAGVVGAFSPDGKILATSTLNLWRVSDGALVRALPGQSGAAVAFSPDGQTIASGGANGSVQIWRVSDGTLLHAWQAEGPGDPRGVSAMVQALAFSEDGQTLKAVQANFALWQWRVSDGALLQARLLPSVHACYLRQAAFSPDASVLAGGPEDTTRGIDRVWIWRVDDANLFKTLQRGSKGSILDLAFSPDGTRVSAGEAGGNVHVWKVKP